MILTRRSRSTQRKTVLQRRVNNDLRDLRELCVKEKLLTIRIKKIQHTPVVIAEERVLRVANPELIADRIHE